MGIAKLPLAKEIEDFVFKGTPINAELVRDLAGGSFLQTPAQRGADRRHLEPDGAQLSHRDFRVDQAARAKQHVLFHVLVGASGQAATLVVTESLTAWPRSKLRGGKRWHPAPPCRCNLEHPGA